LLKNVLSMKSGLLYSFIYQLVFAALSLFTIAVVEGIGEMFAYVFWFNLTYALCGIPTNSAAYYLGKKVFSGRFKSMIIFNFTIALIVINLLFYFLDRSFATVNLFTGDGSFIVSISTHCLLLISVLASQFGARLLGTTGS
jgi:hypothetical protein